MQKDNLRAAVIGAGYVGLATAVVLAEQGHHVLLVERDPDRLTALADGRIPFHEPGLPEAYATQHARGRIVPRADVPRDGLDLVVVCVGTPVGETGNADVSHVAHALDKPYQPLRRAPCASCAARCRSDRQRASGAGPESRSSVSLSRRSSCARGAPWRTSASPLA